MKGEYAESKNHFNNTTPSNISMFAKLHQIQNFQHNHHRSPPQPTAPSSSTNDGATIEVFHRPRGRPPGSKNKPKPTPNYITTTHDEQVENKSIMSPYILEIPFGVDIIHSVYQFCRKQNMGLCILNGSGTVTNVTLKQPFTNNPDSTITFHGNFNILSISATIIPQSIFSKVPNGFSISLAGPQGQVVGGPVNGPLLSAGPVYLIAASFNNPFYHKFPAEDDDGAQSLQAAVSGGGDDEHPPESTPHEYCYSSNQLPSDVIRAPTSRQLSPY